MRDQINILTASISAFFRTRIKKKGKLPTLFYLFTRQRRNIIKGIKKRTSRKAYSCLSVDRAALIPGTCISEGDVRKRRLFSHFVCMLYRIFFL